MTEAGFGGFFVCLFLVCNPVYLQRMVKVLFPSAQQESNRREFLCSQFQASFNHRSAKKFSRLFHRAMLLKLILPPQCLSVFVVSLSASLTTSFIGHCPTPCLWYISPQGNLLGHIVQLLLKPYLVPMVWVVLHVDSLLGTYTTALPAIFKTPLTS